MNTKKISLVLLIIAVVLGICSWFLIPEVVTVQVGMDGQATNTMPKILAILILFGISAAGSILNLTHQNESNMKGWIITAVGIVAMILTLIFNR